MKIGIVGGTGPAGKGLALRLSSVGYEVGIGSRSSGRAAEIVEEAVDSYPDRTFNISGVSNEEAARAETVVLATPWDSCAPTAKAYREILKGKLVICMANALARVGNEFHALYPPRGSIAADVQASVPLSRVSMAFQHLPAKELGEIESDMIGDVLVCADEQSAIDETIEIVERMPKLRGLDCGSLANAAPVEAFTAVLLQLNRLYKTRSSVHITGLE
ncbi:MAG: NADPH-dependent F420 reductase [Acidimicrobiales bacterium]|nr:NADPH-dependent F420 reductase [Acidimicrobiales bacterium]